MKVLLVLVGTFSINSAVLNDMDSKFQAFMEQHKKMYANKEKIKRLSIFKINLEKIDKHNELFMKGLVSYELGITDFADMTTEEYLKMIKGQVTSEKLTKFKPSEKEFDIIDNVKVPVSKDWRKNNIIGPVIHQGFCGSCWAFSITGGIEGAYALKTGKLTLLSNQQLIDCTTHINKGCTSGYLERTLIYIQKYGLESEKVYPYLAKNDNCTYNPDKVVARIKSYISLEGDEQKIKVAVGTIGPVSALINGANLQLYKSGIFDKNICTSQLNHAILLVGYGQQGSQKYWIAKNSWGSAWGENGYFRILRDLGNCTMVNEAFVPII